MIPIGRSLPAVRIQKKKGSKRDMYESKTHKNDLYLIYTKKNKNTKTQVFNRNSGSGLRMTLGATVVYLYLDGTQKD